MKTLIPIFGLLACCLPAAAEGPHRVKIVNAAAVMPLQSRGKRDDPD